MRIRFGVHCPPEGLAFNQVKETCLDAEEQGYDLFTVTDHFYPMRPSSLGFPLECWSTLSGLAAISTRIKIGSLVSCAWYRSPALLAKIATTVDLISDGRLILGIGAGWHEEEFKSFFGRFASVKERLDALEEAAHILKRILRREEVTFTGKHYHVENLVNSPPSSQTPIPLLIGGGGERRTLLIAAKYCDISHFSAPDPEVMEGKINALKEHCRRVDRDLSEITLATSITPGFKNGDFSSEFIDHIEACVSLGVKMFSLRSYVYKERAKGIQKRFAEEVIHSFK